jgi:hypothetical protein
MLLYASAAAACAAGVGDHLAGAVAFRAGLLYREKALLHAHLAVAVAAGAFGRLRAGFSTRAFAGAAFFECWNAGGLGGCAFTVKVIPNRGKVK